MPFPTYGSWISSAYAPPIGSDNLKFTATYTQGSSSIQCAVYDETNSTSYISFSEVDPGLNIVSLNPNVTGSYRVHFRLIGYPSEGFNPRVEGFEINYAAVGGQVQTINIGSDVQLPTSKYTVANLDVEGSFTWYSTGSVSSDAGSTWTPVPNYGLDVNITNPGSEPIIRIRDLTGSSTITKIIAYFHGSDIN